MGHRAYYWAGIAGPTFVFAAGMLRKSGERGISVGVEALLLGLLLHLATLVVFIVVGGLLESARAGGLGDTSPATEAEREQRIGHSQNALKQHVGAAGWAGAAGWWACDYFS
jgi:hypothetical protein